ncbi:MAG: methyl-accepting chemotaxis protein [Candidatus Omnitrophica bacterium]|nr:methyl-accepting chemotaxis protein [Candidatus Omnitrophota bacterium]
MQKRRNYFIKPRFQINFISKFVALILLEFVLIMTWVMTLSSNTMTTGYHNSILTVEKTWAFYSVPFLLMSGIIVLAIAIVGMTAFILLSHRIAGPLYRFERDLERVGAGDLTTRINLRRTDQLDEVQLSLNKLIDTYDQRLSQIKKRVSGIQWLLQDKEDPELYSKLREHVQRLDSELNHFKVHGDQIKT